MARQAPDELCADRPRETPWYLPDGRSANVIAPATGTGRVIYVFEDMTERLALETRHNALISVQRETLNALNEGCRFRHQRAAAAAQSTAFGNLEAAGSRARQPSSYR